MRIYHTPGTRSTRVVWTLEEIGEPYELTVLRGDERRQEAHRRRHPLGRVPVVELDDGQHLFESAAICLQLADLHPEVKLIPSGVSTARGLVYQWTVFAMTELELKTFGWRSARRRGDDETNEAEAFARVADALRDALAKRTWLVDETFTVADIVTISILANVAGDGYLSESDPLVAYVERGRSRPGYARGEAVGR